VKASRPTTGAWTWTCEREGCDQLGRDYYITHGVVHVDVNAGNTAQVYTGRDGDGWIVLCPEHALADLGVAFP